jgi:hypothetical protein
MQDTPDNEGTARTQRLATRPAALPLGAATQLIGTMGAPGARRALLRAADGAVRTVTRGDIVAGVRVVEVEPEALRLHHGDRESRLQLVAAEPMSVSPRPKPRPQAPSRVRMPASA